MIFFHHHHSSYNPYRSTLSDRNPVIYHQPTGEPALSPVYRDELWWLGAGTYSQQIDGLWKRWSTRFSGKWQQTRYFGTEADAASYVLRVADAEWEINKAVRKIGLEPVSMFPRIEKAQCEMLERIAERWHLSYCWSELSIHRHFQKSLLSYGFNWNYGGK